MSIRVQDAGTLRTLEGILAKQGGLVRDIRKVFVQHGGSLRTVAVFSEPLSASISPTEVSDDVTSGSPATVTAGPCTASPIGGTAPFTYAWVRTSGVGTITAPTLATTSFQYTTPAGVTTTGTFQVTITDADGQTATDSIIATYTNFGGA